jgi:hypothetical protein
MPFGWCNAPANFQRMMIIICRNLLDNGIVIFIDNILVNSHGSKQQHTNLVSKVLHKCNKNEQAIEICKCKFFKQELWCLGYKISEQGISIDTDCIQAVLDLSTPTNLKEIKQFIGFGNFYRWFIKKYSSIITALTK